MLRVGGADLRETFERLGLVGFGDGLVLDRLNRAVEDRILGLVLLGRGGCGLVGRSGGACERCDSKKNTTWRSATRARTRREDPRISAQIQSALGAGSVVEAIAAKADIAPRTFFAYFPTKEDVVLADYAARLERITAELAQQPETQAPWAALRAAFVIVADDYVARRDELVRRFEIMSASPSVYARSLQLQAGWEDALADVLARRGEQSADNLAARLMASAALACMRSSLRHWLLTGHDAALPGLIQSCFAQLADGLTEISPTLRHHVVETSRR